MFDRCCCRRTRQTIALELERLNEFVQWLLISDMGLCAGIWCKNTTLSKYPNRKIVKLHHNVDIGAVDIWCHQITNCCIQFVFCRCLLLTTCALLIHTHTHWTEKNATTWIAFSPAQYLWLCGNINFIGASRYAAKILDQGFWHSTNKFINVVHETKWCDYILDRFYVRFAVCRIRVFSLSFLLVRYFSNTHSLSNV